MSDGEAGARLRAAADGARTGDPEAFRALVAETYATVFRLAVALVSDRDEAADVTQETYVRAWGRIDELRDAAAALGWLCRIARNVAHDRRRSWWSRIRAPLDALSGEAAPPEGAPDAALASSERSAAVRAALAKLPEKHRVVLALRELEGLSYDEIAAATGVPVGTVESRLHRARAALARRLSGLRQEGEP